MCLCLCKPKLLKYVSILCVFFNKYYENAKKTDHHFLGEVSYAGNLANQPMRLKGIVSGNFDHKI